MKLFKKMGNWFYRKWRWFLAYNRLNLDAVCEMSKGLPAHADYHDFRDDEYKFPDHFRTLKCERCGKEFVI